MNSPYNRATLFFISGLPLPKISKSRFCTCICQQLSTCYGVTRCSHSLLTESGPVVSWVGVVLWFDDRMAAVAWGAVGIWEDNGGTCVVLKRLMLLVRSSMTVLLYNSGNPLAGSSLLQRLVPQHFFTVRLLDTDVHDVAHPLFIWTELSLRLLSKE